MNNKELFNACTTRCVWCQEQWPIFAPGLMLHVGPFTRDEKLFSVVCDAGQIREAFDYLTYKGGKQIKWKVPSAKTLRASSNIVNPSTRRFWRVGNTASLDVSKWPDWKHSADYVKPTPSQLASIRRELLLYDALDYHARGICTDNQRFLPIYNNKGRIAEPACNHGIGCTACWERYQQFYDRESNYY